MIKKKNEGGLPIYFNWRETTYCSLNDGEHFLGIDAHAGELLMALGNRAGRQRGRAAEHPGKLCPESEVLEARVNAGVSTIVSCNDLLVDAVW